MRISLNGRMSIEADDVLVEENRLGGARARLAFAVLVLERPRPVDRFHLARGAVAQRPAPLLGGRPAGGDEPGAGLPGRRRPLRHRRAHQQPRLLPAQPAGGRGGRRRGGGGGGRRGRGGLGRRETCTRALAAASDVRDITARPFIAGAEGEWLDGARRRQRAQRVRALDVLARSALGLGDAGRALDAAQELLSLDPYRDASHVLIMEVHRAAGNRAQALRAYGWCRHVLAEELGVDPAPETEALYRSLLREEHGRGTGREAAWVTSGAARPPTNLPAQLTSFVGRGRELREVRRLLEGDRLVTVTGPPGSGKTRLALEVAGRSLAAHTGGTWFVDLAPAGRRGPGGPGRGRGGGRGGAAAHDAGRHPDRPPPAAGGDPGDRQLRARPRGDLHPGRRAPAGLPPPVGAGHQPPAPRRAGRGRLADPGPVHPGARIGALHRGGAGVRGAPAVRRPQPGGGGRPPLHRRRRVRPGPDLRPPRRQSPRYRAGRGVRQRPRPGADRGPPRRPLPPAHPRSPHRPRPPPEPPAGGGVEPRPAHRPPPGPPAAAVGLRRRLHPGGGGGDRRGARRG